MAFATASFVTTPVVSTSVPPLQHTASASQSLWQFQFDRECLIWAVLQDFEFCSTRYLQRNINLVNRYSLQIAKLNHLLTIRLLTFFYFK